MRQIVFLIRPDAIETVIVVYVSTNKITVLSARKYLWWISLKINLPYISSSRRPNVTKNCCIKCKNAFLFIVLQRHRVIQLMLCYVGDFDHAQEYLRYDYALITLTNVIVIMFEAQSVTDFLQSANRDGWKEGKLRSKHGKAAWARSRDLYVCSGSCYITGDERGKKQR